MPTTQPPFNLPAVEAAIVSTEFATHLHHLPSTTSTQTLALQAAQAGARHGVWIADFQTAGRGRGNHTWLSEPNQGLHLTALITPAIPLPSAMRLSLLTALAAQSAIHEITGFAIPHEIDIRWPNDLILHRRKVGGILIESAANPATPASPTPTLRYAAIGIGINCNQLAFPPDLDAAATSLRRELPRAASTQPAPLIPREPLLASLLRHLDAEIQTLSHPDTRDLTQHSTWLLGKRVQVPEDGSYTGTTAGLTPEGFLQVHADDGTLRTVRSGGVREKDS